MAIETEQQSVTVTDESPMVNVEAGGQRQRHLSSRVLIWNALSDDPDELSNEFDGPGPVPRPVQTDGQILH